MSTMLKPAFEVTNVRSMQWNRTCLAAGVCAYLDEDGAMEEDTDLAIVPEDVMVALREAIATEVSYLASR